MSRAILHATDYSPASRPAFAKAMEMARRDHAPLLIAHVMAPVMPMMAGDGYISPTTWDAIAKGYRTTSQKKLDVLVRRAKRAGVRARGLLLEGTPAARVLLGSVASRVVATASCPVTTVRGR